MGGPPVRVVPVMPLGARCPHCDTDEAVIPVSDHEKDGFIYACVHCGWWGLDPLRTDFPPTDEIASRVAQKSGTTLRFRRR